MGFSLSIIELKAQKTYFLNLLLTKFNCILYELTNFCQCYNRFVFFTYEISIFMTQNTLTVVWLFAALSIKSDQTTATQS